MSISSKKAQSAALLGLVLSLVFFAVLLFGGLYWKTLVVYELAWQLLAGAMVWLVLFIQFYHRSQAEQEKLDVSRMSKALQQETIFSSGASKAALFEQAQKRLVFFEKWILPILSIFIAVYELFIGWKMIKWSSFIAQWTPTNPMLSASLVILVAFITFLVSRWTTGMSSELLWRPLRAGGSYLLTTAATGFAAFLVLIAAKYKYTFALTILEYGIAWMMIVLGVEILLNTLLDIYRPRIAGQYSQAGIDSRLLGVINEPGGLFHSVANTIDYQFGFQVSHTWFYRLLEKAILPLILFASVVLYFMTSVVIVGPGQIGVIEHFGSAQTESGGRLIGSGLAFKWPWPFDKVYVYPTELVQKVNIGFVDDEKEKTAEEKNLLWGKEHYKEEFDLVVASPSSQGIRDEDTVPVGLVRYNIPVLYRIRDVSAYLYNHIDSQAMLEAICYRELAKFGASSTVETDEDFIETSLLGQGRLAASMTLKERIQKAADDAGLGVEIVLCSLQGIHPLPKLAQEYQSVVASIQSRQAAVLDAIAYRNKMLAELAGSAEEVAKLYSLVGRYSQVKDTLTPEQNEQLRKEITSALMEGKGQVFRTIRNAESEAFEKAVLAEATGSRFAGQLKAYQANPDLYKRIERLKMLEETLENIRKYVVVADPKDSQVYIVDLQEKLNTGLYEGLDMTQELKDANK